MGGGELSLHVEDLAGHLEKSRGFSGSRAVSLRLGETRIRGEMLVSGTIAGTVDGVQARFEAGARAEMTCVRCLSNWAEEVSVSGSQHYSTTPDEDGYGIVDGVIDVAGPATDELALGLPPAPVCRPGCRGLCPICGTDLNSDPCDGHGDDSGSPFAVLKDLFDP